MARHEISTEAHGGATIVVAKLIGQAERDTLSKLNDDLVAMARGGLVRILLDESELRPGLILPYDIRGIVDQWRSLLARSNVRLAAVAPNPIIYGLTRLGLSMVSRDTGGRVAAFQRRDQAIEWLAGDRPAADR